MICIAIRLISTAASLAYLILRERIGGATIVGIAVATVGVLLLVSRGNLANVDWLSRVGDWLALASAFTWALYTIATRDLSRAYPPMAITVLMMIPATFLLTGYVLMTSGLGAVARMSTEAVVALVFTWSPWPRRPWPCHTSAKSSAGTVPPGPHWFWQASSMPRATATGNRPHTKGRRPESELHHLFR